MDTHAHSDDDASAHRVGNVSEQHNASVDEDAARQGGCAQVHLPTGRMCSLPRAHAESCEFSPAGQARDLLAKRTAANHG